MRTIKALLLLFIVCFVSLAEEEPSKPGLIGEYFQMSFDVSDFPVLPADKKPTLKRVDPQIAFEFVKGNFHGTGMLDRWQATAMVPALGVVPPTARLSHSSTRSAPPASASRAESRSPTQISTLIRFPIPSLSLN